MRYWAEVNGKMFQLGRKSGWRDVFRTAASQANSSWPCQNLD